MLLDYFLDNDDVQSLSDECQTHILCFFEKCKELQTLLGDGLKASAKVRLSLHAVFCSVLLNNQFVTNQVTKVTMEPKHKERVFLTAFHNLYRIGVVI